MVENALDNLRWHEVMNVPERAKYWEDKKSEIAT